MKLKSGRWTWYGGWWSGRGKVGGDAFGDLYRQYHAPLFRLARAHLGEGAEDAVAETFLRAWKGLPGYKDTGAPFLAWLYGIARHVIADEFRRRARVEPRAELPEGLVAWKVDDELALAAAIRELPDEQQQVIELKFLMGATNAQVATALGKSEGAVNAKQWQALGALRKDAGGDMRSSLGRDLARWERGELSLADLGLRHPGRAGGMVALYQRLTDIGTAAVPDPEPLSERLWQRLPQRPVMVPARTVGPAFVLRRLVARPLALAAALLLFGAAVGYAAAPQALNHRLTTIWENVEDLFRDEPRQGGPDRTPASPGDDEPGLAPSVPDDKDGDDGDGGDDGEAGEDDGEDGDDDREGPSEDSGEGSGDGDEADEAAEPSDGGSSNDGPGDGSDEGSGSDGSSFEEEADETSLDPDDAVEPDD